MFTTDGQPSGDDPHERDGPTLGDERTTLVEALALPASPWR